MVVNSSPNPLPFTRGEFKLDQPQIDRARAWLAEHKMTCPHLSPQTAGWLGSPLAYTFMPHGLGEEVRLVCNCGQKCDLTNDSESIVEAAKPAGNVFEEDAQ